MTPYCEIRKSKEPNGGNGVFATKFILAGETIGEYTGPVVAEAKTQEELDKLTEPLKNKYLWTQVPKWYGVSQGGKGDTFKAIDGSNCMMGKLNSCFQNEDKQNVEIDNEGTCFTLRYVQKDEELLTKYGDYYTEEMVQNLPPPKKVNKRDTLPDLKEMKKGTCVKTRPLEIINFTPTDNRSEALTPSNNKDVLRGTKVTVNRTVGKRQNEGSPKQGKKLKKVRRKISFDDEDEDFVVEDEDFDKEDEDVHMENKNNDDNKENPTEFDKACALSGGIKPANVVNKYFNPPVLSTKAVVCYAPSFSEEIRNME